MAVTPPPKKSKQKRKKKQVVDDGVILRSSKISTYRRNGITTSDGEPLQCQEGRQAFKSRCLFHFLPPPAKCGTVVLSGILTPGTILLGSASGSGGREMEEGRERKKEGETCRMTRGREVVVGAHNHCTTWWPELV